MHTSNSGPPGETRTHNPRLRRPVLYPVELRAVRRAVPEIQPPGRGERIRTFDILLPKQARYRAALHPEERAFY